MHSVANDSDQPAFGRFAELPSRFADDAFLSPIIGGAKRRRFPGRGTSSGDLQRRSRVGKKVAAQPSQARGNKTLERSLDQKKLVQ